jgi:hypothetical protein
MDRLLHHPYVTGKASVRMLGEEPEFDVFISYRDGSDNLFASNLCNKLTKLGLSVWWDKKCLQPGVSWEVTKTKTRFIPFFLIYIHCKY